MVKKLKSIIRNWKELKHFIKHLDSSYLNSFLLRFSRKIRQSIRLLLNNSIILKIRRFVRSIHDSYSFFRAKKQLKPSSDSTKIPVLFIFTHLDFGGVEKVGLDILTHLDPEKYEICIFTTRKSPHNWYSKFSTITPHIWHLSSILSEDRYEEFVEYFLRRVPIHLVVVNHSIAGYKLCPFLKKHFPELKFIDIIHSQGGEGRGGIRECIQTFASYFDRRIAVSENVKNYFVKEFQLSSETLSVIYNGVDTEFFAPNSVMSGKYRSKYGIDQLDSIICFSGRLRTVKHPELVVGLAACLRKQGQRDVKFIIAGAGKRYYRIQDKIEELGLQKEIFLPGYVEDIRSLLKDTTIFFLCSEREGVPLVILEALAMGIPVVASQVGGIPELIKNGENGYLIPFDDQFIPRSAEKIITLLSDHDLYRQISENNRKKAQQHFSITRMVQRYEEVFKQLVREK